MQQQLAQLQPLPTCLYAAWQLDGFLDSRQDWPAISRAFRSMEAKSRLFAKRLACLERDGKGINFNLPIFAEANTVSEFEALANEFTGTCGTDPIADIQLDMFNNHVGGWTMRNVKTVDDLLSAVRQLRSMSENVQRSCAGRIVAKLELDPQLIDPEVASHRKILEILSFHSSLDFGDGHDEVASAFLFTKKIYAQAALSEGVRMTDRTAQRKLSRLKLTS